MTYQALKNYPQLRKEYVRLREKVSEIERAMKDPATASLPGTSHGGSWRHDRIADYMARLDTLHGILAERELAILDAQAQVERFISEIPDSLVRETFELHFLDGKSWLKTALALGGGNTEEAARMRVKRYLKKTGMFDALPDPDDELGPDDERDPVRKTKNGKGR